ncbi:unnamed protein product [Calypogeia fissa]
MAGEPEHEREPMHSSRYRCIELPMLGTEAYMKKMAEDGNKSNSLSPTTVESCSTSSPEAANIAGAGTAISEQSSVVSEVDNLHDKSTDSLQGGPQETTALQGDNQSNAGSEDGGRAEKDGREEEKDGSQEEQGGGPAETEASDPTTAGDETTSSDENFELPANVVVLKLMQRKSDAPEAECSVYIVGTAHVSKKSCDEVQAVIRNVKPKVVFLELCSSRVALIMPQKVQVPTFDGMVRAYKKKDTNLFGILYGWFLAKVAHKLEVVPGAEFRVAFEEACASGARVVFGDRPIQVTLRRTWARMSTWHKTKLIFALVVSIVFMDSAEQINQMIEDFKDNDMITAIIQDMSKSFPSLADTLVHERDLYMAAALRGIAGTTSSVVAVVGKGHVPGISENWEADISVEELLTVPTKKPSWFSKPALRWSAIAVAVGGLAIYFGVYYNQKS